MSNAADQGEISLHSQPGNCAIPNEYKIWVSFLAIDPELDFKSRNFREMSKGEVQCDLTHSESQSQDKSLYLGHPADH